MVLIKSFLTSLATGLLFTLVVLGGSFSFLLHTNQGVETTKVVNGEDAVSVNQELFDGVPALSSFRNIKLGGRKMVVDTGLKKEVIKDGAVKGETAKISGKDETDAANKLLGGSQKKVNDQTGSSDLSNTNHLNSQGAETTAATEAKRLLEDTIDIVNLMHKDYTGMGKGRRKPPIHNSAPMERENEKP